jgi:high-affinity nickel permease
MDLTSGMSAFAVLSAGFVIGLRHALDADHLAAVSAIVSDRKNFWSSSIVGGLWGVGHTISLFVAGIIVIILKSTEITTLEMYEPYLEAVVGVMLVLLGLNVLRKLFTAEKVHLHEHAHAGRSHTHLHIHHEDEAPAAHHSFGPRSVIVGMIHGLAGSAGLMLLILPTIQSTFLAMAFILIFGIGSIGGMMAMSFLMGLPLHFTADKFEVVNKGIRVAAGLFSFGLGALIVYEKLIAA